MLTEEDDVEVYALAKRGWSKRIRKNEQRQREVLALVLAEAQPAPEISAQREARSVTQVSVPTR